jgi:hypothetical protein
MRAITRTRSFVAATVLVSLMTAFALTSPPAAADDPIRPTLTSTEASFTIPGDPPGTWMLRLWTLPDKPPAQLVGEIRGTSGTLTLPVPQSPDCTFQADVRFAPAGTTDFSFYSGAIDTVAGCGLSGDGPRLTPGYWKNHEEATMALLPQNLGFYLVDTADEATAVLQSMRCNDATNCLAGHLLAAVLDVANGSSICISGVIFRAQTFLEQVGYHGPDTYTISGEQRALALALKDQLDSYTNDTTELSC